MAELEQGLEELKVVKQAFKDNIQANNVSTSNVEFRDMPNLLKQMEKKLPTQTKEVAPSTSPQTITPDSGYKLSQVNIKAVVPSDYYKPEQVLSVSPKITSQTITPSANYVYNKVNINAVTSSIDNNIQSTNIKKGVSILGVTGTLEGTVAPKLQEKNINPTTNSQSVVADNGYDGLSKVNVSAVTSEIDGNIKPENIKKDVSILGVIGNLVQTSGDAKFGQLVDGTITAVEEGDLASVTSIRDGVFNGLSINLVSIPSNVSSIGTNAFSNNKISNLTISDGVTTIGASAFENNQISTLTIPQSVTTIGASAFAGNELIELTMESDTPPVVTETSFPSSLTTTNVSYNGYQNYVDDENWQTYKATLVRGLAIPSTITVTVNNYLGEFVNGAVVTIEGDGKTFTGITNANGVFIQGDLQPATYTISVAEIDGFKTPTSQEIIVTENTQNNVVFTYLEKPAILPFAESSAEQIAEISAEISAQNMTSAQVAETYGWNLGDKTSITLSTGEVIEMQIIGFNHDDKSDGSGKAGITLQMVNCLATTYGVFKGGVSISNWGNSTMKTSTLPTYFNLLPIEWQNVIKTVTNYYVSKGGGQGYVRSTSAQLFLLSEIEIFGTSTVANLGSEEGTQYEYWSNNNSETNRIKYLDNSGTLTSVFWWLRSISASSANNFCAITNNGKISSARGSTTDVGVSFAFCV